jgi:hypothetical protein
MEGEFRMKANPRRVLVKAKAPEVLLAGDRSRRQLKGLAIVCGICIS